MAESSTTPTSPTVQPESTGTISSIPSEPTKAYTLKKIDWAAIGKLIEDEIKESKIWSEDYYRYPGHAQAVLYKHAIGKIVEALPSKEG